jgi:indolepyruvate ferredoxin oxidoreductase beta subunit
MSDTINFLLAGVGGQGTILASDVLVNVGLASGYQAKQAEVHGMSQRGGSVTSFVRWGAVVYSPLVGAGEVDILLAFEKVEALRNLRQVRPGGLVLVNMEAIEPLTVTSGNAVYPDDDRLYESVAQVTDQAAFIQGPALAAQVGNPRTANVVLLGALSALMERQPSAGPQVPEDTWLAVIIERVPPKYVELNKRAFQVGREAVLHPA